MIRLSACFFAIVLMVACNKKEKIPKKSDPVKAPRVIVTDKPTKAGENGPLLPTGTTLTIAENNYSIEVELPGGYSFTDNGDGPVTNSVQPVRMATYYCRCSSAGSAYQVMYADGAGFGCLHSSCSGTCTGDFIYKGYSMNRVLSLPVESKEDFLNEESIQEKIKAQFALCINSNIAAKGTVADQVYVKQTLYGVSYYFLATANQLRSGAILEVIPYGKASCACEEGTYECKMKTFGFALDKTSPVINKIYYCDGKCSCELTVR